MTDFVFKRVELKFRLTYRVVLKKSASEKEMLDAIRVRNGNLEVSCARADENDRDL